jgi:FMN phosphatase YigB (HAD superfamily)
MPTAPQQRVASFDVFDTLVTRAVGEPAAMFLLLGHELARAGTVDVGAEVFARQRREADERAFALSGGDPPLDLVADELARALGRPELAPALHAAELDLEHRLTRPVPGARERLDAARARGDRVVFVSDTNLREPELAALLERHGMREPGEAVFASCELGASKSRGTLFPRVAQALGVHPRQITHHGDNATADVRNGRLSAWRTVHLPDASLNRYELALERHRTATGGLTSLMAGASRLARLRQPAADARERALVDTAAGVMAPVLVGWTLWVLRRAQQEGLRRLYFVSRDGQVLLELARRLEPQLRTGIDLRYLHGSRQAWLLAGVGDAAAVEELNDDRDFRSVRTVAANYGLEASDLAPFLPEALRDPAAWDRDLGATERESVTALASRDEVRAMVRGIADDRLERLGAFLRQEGMADAARAGIVDVGWRGRTTLALASALERSGLPLPGRYFFFGLGPDAHEVVGPRLAPLLEAYHYDAAAGHGYVEHPSGLAGCIEMFCAADHGTVTGYERRDGTIAPVLAPPPTATLAWGLPLVRATAYAFADALVLDEGLVDVRADVRPAVRDLLALFWEEPTPAEVAAWGPFPIDVDQAHTKTTEMASPVDLAAVATQARATGRIQLRPTLSWPVGTARRSGPVARRLLEARFRLGAELPRARRRAAWLRDQAAVLRQR